MPSARPTDVGDILREWRRRRRLSQLDLAGDAEISARHLSFVESGRAVASRTMLLRLAEPLGMPLRDRNRLLLAGGYAPVYQERDLGDDAMSAARMAIETILSAHMPFPALVVDRHWTLLAQNDAVAALIGSVDPQLLQPPVNVLRLSLHPLGLADRIANLAEWRLHLLSRLRREVATSGDRTLAALVDELSGYPHPRAVSPMPPVGTSVAVPLRITVDGDILSLLSTTTVFGTATDIALSELTLECFFPADERTRAILMAARPQCGDPAR